MAQGSEAGKEGTGRLRPRDSSRVSEPVMKGSPAGIRSHRWPCGGQRPAVGALTDEEREVGVPRPLGRPQPLQRPVLLSGKKLFPGLGDRGAAAALAAGSGLESEVGFPSCTGHGRGLGTERGVDPETLWQGCPAPLSVRFLEGPGPCKVPGLGPPALWGTSWGFGRNR